MSSKNVVKRTVSFTGSYQRNTSIENESSETSNESKAVYRHEKKKVWYLRHFPNIEEEVVLKRYPCALASDFLRQGYLYVTENYIAFHSNIFGYVTKLLIPLRSIDAITKQRTAKIIPNAIGITTAEGKHIFASFLSRDKSYELMVKVWQQAKSDDGEFYNSGSEFSETSIYTTEEEIEEIEEIKENPPETPKKAKPPDKPRNVRKQVPSSKLYNFMFYSAIILIIFLFLSSSLLLFRIIKVHGKYADPYSGKTVKLDQEVLQDFLQRRPDLVKKSYEPINNVLSDTLNHVSDVRNSLESLYSLLYLKTDGDSPS